MIGILIMIVPLFVMLEDDGMTWDDKFLALKNARWRTSLTKEGALVGSFYLHLCSRIKKMLRRQAYLPIIRRQNSWYVTVPSVQSFRALILRFVDM